MKVMVETQEYEGLDALMGGPIVIFCMNYIYAGKLVGVNDTCVKLEDAKIVYETGAFSDAAWKDAQSLGKEPHYVQVLSIESFRKGK